MHYYEVNHQIIQNVSCANFFIDDGSVIEREMDRLAREQSFITFYNENDPYTEWLGNFYPVKVQYGGLEFLNSEAAFQAQKFDAHPEIMELFTNLSGDEAFYKAREHSALISADWRARNVQVMKNVLKAKISQNPQIAEWLEATGHSLLIEHNPKKGRDLFWSDDCDGSGMNMLGKLWMEIRAELRNESIEASDPSHRRCSPPAFGAR